MDKKIILNWYDFIFEQSVEIFTFVDNKLILVCISALIINRNLIRKFSRRNTGLLAQCTRISKILPSVFEKARGGRQRQLSIVYNLHITPTPDQFFYYFSFSSLADYIEHNHFIGISHLKMIRLFGQLSQMGKFVCVCLSRWIGWTVLDEF